MKHLTLEDLGFSASVEPMTLAHQDSWFEFPGYFRRPAHTQIEVWSRAKGGYSVVIATELENNDGVSITNGCESLAATVCRKFNIEPKKLVLVEYYPKDSALDAHYSLIKFKKILRPLAFQDRQWFPLEKSELERLLR